MNSTPKDPPGAGRNANVGSAATDSADAPQVNWMLILRLLLVLDGLLLFALGAFFIFMPAQAQQAFHFNGLPPGVSYLIGLWGCVLFTMGFGYCVAATNPIRHLVWVQVAIGRGALECALGLVYLARGVVTLQQAVFGIVVAALMTLAYLAVYPRKHRDIRAVAGPTTASK